MTGLIVANTAFAEDKTEGIDKIFRWVKPDSPGCTVAASQDGKLVVSRAYGLADLERGVENTPDSVFDIGSIQKQFAAAAALLLVEDGKLSLTEDIRTYIPELPDYGHKVTVDHLLTHTSGIRDWPALQNLAGGKPQALPLILRQRGLNFPPGEEFMYSNSGVVLTREIVARVSGMSYGDFTRTRMFEPLGMNSTSYRADLREVIKNRAMAYERVNEIWRMAMVLDNDHGGGGILSTAVDLVTWTDALANNRLGAFVSEKIQEPATLNNGRKLRHGRGAFLESAAGVRLVSHSGSADGYQAYVSRFPDHGVSVAVLCNAGKLDQGEYAGRIFDVLVPSAPAKPGEGEGPPPTIPDGMDLSERMGLFINQQTGALMRLTVDRGRLRVAGGPGLVVLIKDRFRRWGDSVYFMSGDAFELNFLSADEFELKSMEGKGTKYRRAAAHAPSPEELKSFADRYENDEIGTVFRIEPKANALAITVEHIPPKTIEFKPADRDLFEFNTLMIVRFRRDAAGVVVGLDYTNPFLRNVKFTRVTDLPGRP